MVDVPGEAPSVLAEWPGEPTVLLYAHYDVQPAPRDGWTAIRSPRCCATGALRPRRADDKSGVAAHSLRCARGAAAARRRQGPDRGLRGERRQRLLGVVDADPELMRADAMVICDGGNWKLGEPTLCESLRGHGKLTLTLTTLEGALHSGQFGGAAPDALLALVRLLATLHDDRGAVAVEGLQDGSWPGAVLPEDFRRQAGVLDGVSLTGGHRRRPLGRTTRSACSIDAPPVDGAGNIVIPSRAGQGRCACRPAPTRSARWTPSAHLRGACQRGAARGRGRASASTPPVELDGGERRRARAGCGVRKLVAWMGSGGSVPLVGKLREAYRTRVRALGRQDGDLRRSTRRTSRCRWTRSPRSLAEALLLRSLPVVANVNCAGEGVGFQKRSSRDGKRSRSIARARLRWRL
jgi:hypothetical protein